jgi:hypothetical protein
LITFIYFRAMRDMMLMRGASALPPLFSRRRAIAQPPRARAICREGLPPPASATLDAAAHHVRQQSSRHARTGTQQRRVLRAAEHSGKAQRLPAVKMARMSLMRRACVLRACASAADGAADAARASFYRAPADCRKFCCCLSRAILLSARFI